MSKTFTSSLLNPFSLKHDLNSPIHFDTRRCAMLKIVTIIYLSFFSSYLFAKTLTCSKTESSPNIDGTIEDLWSKAKEISVQDAIEKVDIKLKCLYNKDYIYFLSSYPDAYANVKHKAKVWNPDLEIYQSGPTREDTFIFKFAMDQVTSDLSLKSNAPYSADIWYWKGFRSDPIGYADDKMHHFGLSPSKKSRRILVNGQIFYLSRPGDSGSSSYKSVLPTEKTLDEVAAYEHRTPQGSRGDIKAKGTWSNKTWNIEWSRQLKTGHSDDVQLDPNHSYKFGVSINEIAASEKKPKVERPNHGTGDIGELLELTFH